MRHNTMLTVAALLPLLLLTLHITDDIVRGISEAESSNIAPGPREDPPQEPRLSQVGTLLPVGLPSAYTSGGV
jgi:hypothetical protein